MRQGGDKTGGGLCFCIFVAFLLHLNKLASIIKLNRSRLMFTSADAIQKDNKDNAAISQDAQRRNAGLTESTNNPDGAAAAECSFAMSEYSNTMSATAEQNVLQRRIHLAAHSDSAPQPVSGGSRSMFYYMFKCMVLKYFSKKGRASRKEYWSFVLFTLSLQMLAFYLFYVRKDYFSIQPDVCPKLRLLTPAVWRSLCVFLLDSLLPPRCH